MGGRRSWRHRGVDGVGVAGAGFDIDHARDAALVVVGVNTTMWVGAVGFAVMVAAAAYAFTPVKEGDASAQAAARTKGRGPTPPKGSSSFMHKLDERWERRERGQ